MDWDQRLEKPHVAERQSRTGRIMTELTYELLTTVLEYHPFTGVLRWKHRHRNLFASDRSCKTWNTRFAGAVAGTTHNGYRDIKVMGVTYNAHRLAWYYCYEKWPENEIIHVDGDSLNNSIGNLRDVTRLESTRNQKLNKNNRSGVSGVRKHSRDGRYYAQIGARERLQHLGVFNTFTEAVEARRAAERNLGYHPYHGRRL